MDREDELALAATGARVRRQRIGRRLGVVAAALVAVLLSVGAYASYQWNRLVVTIRHDAAASAPATGVELSAHGDRHTIERLFPGEQRDIVLEPDGESSLELRYELGGDRCHWGGGYVEPAGGYRVLLEIRGCGAVRDVTSLWP